MNWIEGLSSAIDYIESNLTGELELDEIAKRAFVSPFYFQKAFSMLCGMTVGEYVRSRRLAEAGSELIMTDAKVIDIALRYGYDSPDSFTKAFTRFHGVTPSAVRKYGATVKSYAPLKIKLTMEGGFTMEYRIVEKEAFTLLGVTKSFPYETAYADVPKFWDEYYKTDKCNTVCGMYGVSIDGSEGSKEFRYMIADNYLPWKDIPEGFETLVIPRLTWAVFPCRGPLPQSLQDVNTKIFSQWLPNNGGYEIAAGYNVEMYSDINDFAKGNQDEQYYTEMWIPVKKK